MMANVRFSLFLFNIFESATKKKTLLLDLDETLIHTCQLKENPEHVVLVPTDNGSKISVRLSIENKCFLLDILLIF